MELLPLVCLCLLSCSGDAVRVVVKEGSDAVLNCSLSTKEDISGKYFDWKKDGQKEVFLYDAGIHYNNGLPGQDDQFKGRVSFFQDQLQNGNASIKITRTKKTDSGNYRCIFPNLQNETSIIELVVDPVLKDRRGEKPGAAPEPYIRTLDDSKDSSLLQCEAHGVPRPTIKWQDSENNILPAEETKISDRGGRFYTTVEITVTKTDNYRCVATQETLSHQIAAVIPVYIQVPPPDPGLSAEAIAGYVVLILLLVVGGVGGGLYIKRLRKENRKRGSRRNTADGSTGTNLNNAMIQSDVSDPAKNCNTSLVRSPAPPVHMSKCP